MRVKYDINTQIVFQICDFSQGDGSVAAYLHNAMYEYCNINAVSLFVDIKSDQLGDFITACKTLHVNGFDVGIPHKSAVIDYLDECDSASRAFKCVNYVKITDGKLYGKGLDGIGMCRSIEKASGSVSGKRILILGGGAVAGLIPAALCEQGAASVVIANRTVEKARYIAEKLHEIYGVASDSGPLEADFLCESAKSADVIVQCTSLGGSGHSCGDFTDLRFVDCLPKHCVAADVLYPTTAFLDRAKQNGLITVSGAPMLYEQQLAMMKLRFGLDVSDDALAYGEEAVALATTMREIRNARKK